jgi:hypothetical protein
MLGAHSFAVEPQRPLRVVPKAPGIRRTWSEISFAALVLRKRRTDSTHESRCQTRNRAFDATFRQALRVRGSALNERRVDANAVEQRLHPRVSETRLHRFIRGRCRHSVRVDRVNTLLEGSGRMAYNTDLRLVYREQSAPRPLVKTRPRCDPHASPRTRSRDP